MLLIRPVVTMTLLATAVLLSFGVGLGGGARILGVLPMPSASHGILMERLMRELSTRGHSITYVAASPPSSPISNMELIHVPGVRDAIMSKIPMFQNKTVSSRKGSPWMALLFTHIMGECLSEHILGDPGVKELVASDRQFDLILGEIMMDESLLAGLSYRFQAPIVGFATTMPMYSANYMVGNYVPSSYIPELFTGYSSEMTLLQRANNHAYSIAVALVYKWWVLPRQDDILKEHFGKKSPYIGDILRNTSLVLVNHHHALGFSRPYVPNMIEIAGVHINDPRPLPADLKVLMDEAEEGVVLFSLGTNVNSSDLSLDKISAILDGFSQLPQKVLWKFEENLEKLPQNVKIAKWVPQTDVLAHPNLKLFITHGGLLSTTEAMSFGVPVVGIPLGGDQHLNMRQVEEAGWGRVLQFDDITADSLQSIVTKVITNPTFKETAIAKSKILKDNPMDPLNRATWWIEYVLRNGGRNLRTSAQDLPWYQMYLLDVSIFIGVLLCLFLFVLQYVIIAFVKLIKLTMLF